VDQSSAVANADRSIRRSIPVIDRCIELAAAGDPFLELHRPLLASWQERLVHWQMGLAGRKRRIALARDLESGLARLKAEYTADRARRRYEAAQQERVLRLEEIRIERAAILVLEASERAKRMTARREIARLEGMEAAVSARGADERTPFDEGLFDLRESGPG
jgi:hypothetical protein